MVVALARPEVHDQFPRLWSTRDLQEIRLPQLTRKASERLVRDLLGTEVTPGTVEQIVDRSAGNAFFLEELIRAVAEGHGDRLPDSVLSMLQLRLDALGPDTKRVLRAASVFGEVFWRDGVAALVNQDPRDQLAILVERELVASSPDSQLPDQIEYVFRHDLIREAAFVMMEAGDRVLAHRLAGGWLVAHGYTDAVSLAGHFSLGEEPARAAEQYARAAQQAIAGNDTEAVLSHAERGLACNPTGAVAVLLRIALAEAHNWRGEHTQAIEVGQQARVDVVRGSREFYCATDEVFYGAGRSGNLGLAIGMVHEMTASVASPDAARQQVRSVARAAIVMLRFGPPGAGAALVQRTEELAARLPIDIGTEQRLHSLRAMAARARGDAGRCLEEHEAGQRACEATHNLRELAFNYLSYGGCHGELGAPDVALALLQRGIQIAERVGATTVTPLLWFSMAISAFDLRQFDDARAHGNRAAALAHESDLTAEGLARWLLARTAHAQGDLDTGEREITTALEKLSTLSRYRALALATKAQLLLGRGDITGARATAAEAMASMRPDDGFEEGESFVRLVEIQALEASGDPSARAATQAAITRLETRASRIEEPWRTSFLAKPDNAATLARRGVE